MTLDSFNFAAEDDARDAMLVCCGSAEWATQMVTSRPFKSAEKLHRHAESFWFALSRRDWLDAFSKHPKIGERSGSIWSTQEQQGMSLAQASTAVAIREMNDQYEDRFGYIFIVCATGKSADEMRSVLAERLTHQPEEELLIAAAEQAKIMHLRLDKLLLTR